MNRFMQKPESSHDILDNFSNSYHYFNREGLKKHRACHEFC